MSPTCVPVGTIQSLLEQVHTYTGMPWWASLAVTTALLRTILTFPLMVYSTNNKAKLEQLQPEVRNLSRELMAEVAAAQVQYGWSSHTAKSHYRTNVRNTSLIQLCIYQLVSNLLRVTFCWLLFITIWQLIGYIGNGVNFAHVCNRRANSNTATVLCKAVTSKLVFHNVDGRSWVLEILGSVLGHWSVLSVESLPPCDNVWAMMTFCLQDKRGNSCLL